MELMRQEEEEAEDDSDGLGGWLVRVKAKEEENCVRGLEFCLRVYAGVGRIFRVFFSGRALWGG